MYKNIMLNNNNNKNYPGDVYEYIYIYITKVTETCTVCKQW